MAKFAAGVVDTGGKFAASVVYTGGNLPPVSLTPVANLPPVVHLELRISPRIFEKILNDPNCAADFSLLNLPKGKSLGRSKPATNS